MHLSLVTRSVFCVAALTACATTPPAAPVQHAGGVSPTLREREDLPAAAREALAARMLRHGDQMGALSIAVVLLDYEVVQLLATRMSEEPVLGRPSPDDEKSLNALLPKSFFVHQDALTSATRRLIDASTGSDDAKLAAAYADVANSCVSCHSAYLHDELVPGPALELPCELDDHCVEEHDEQGEAEPWNSHL